MVCHKLMLLVAVLTWCGIGSLAQTETVLLTDQKGVIKSLENAIDITYEIVAPAGKKIEVTIEHFNFIPCTVQEVETITAKNNQACLKNHHMIIANRKGALDNEFYTDMMRNSTEWVFCDINRPYNKYISLSNELTISTRFNGLTPENVPSYSMRYRFLNSEFIQNGQIRVVQDIEKLSSVNGYLHTIKVPAMHHLRIMGKSNKCLMPTYSVLSKQSFDKLFNRVNKVLLLNSVQFNTHNCSYSFDISEPQVVNRVDWTIEWFLRFDSSFSVYDFEITWEFIRNQIINEKKEGAVELPLQYGFNISEELEFAFLSPHSQRKYTLNLQTLYNNTDVLEEQQSYIRSRILGLQELRIPLLSKSFTKSEHNLTRFNGTLFIKRNAGWSLRIGYELLMNSGDCDFDESFCGYSNREFKESESPFVTEGDSQIFHMPKYSVVNSFSNEADKKDFYFGISNTTNTTIYSPTIRVQDTQSIDQVMGSINSKLISLSFSYMYQTSSDKLSLLIDSRRSDVPATVVSGSVFKTVIASGMASEYPASRGIHLKNANDHCNSEDFLNVWRRVENMPMFSCFDFRLGFGFESSQTMGLDNVEINYMNDELTKCDEIQQCSNNGECYEFNGEPICCCFPGFIGTDCSIKQNPCEFITCQNNATCVQSNGFDYECTCPIGFTGVHCETEINECLSNPCANNGICHDRIGTYECACQPGFSGFNCGQTSELCKLTCTETGTLKCLEAGSTSVKCQCKPGFTGPTCDININECVSNPCVNGATCVDKVDGFECMCTEDREGKYCQAKVDYCERHEHMCQENSVCIEANSTSVIKCACAHGFTGTFCTERIFAKRDCKPGVCMYEGVCIEQEIGYTCDCPKGRVGNNCEATPVNPCFGNKCQNGHCMSTPEDPLNPYVCKCYDNFAGEFCERKECSVENIDQFCVANNTAEVLKDKSFHDQLVCRCICKNGYFGERCEIRLDLCDEIEHAIGVLKSEANFINYGKHCSNGGTCLFNNDQNTVECLCAPGYFGGRCQQRLTDACQMNPCKYGTCTTLVDDPDDYECKCSNGWTGRDCDEQIVCAIEDECLAENTISVKYSFADNRCICACKHGFTGNDCSVNYDDCANLKSEFTCKNGGTCIDKIGTYECKCPAGFGGYFCEQKLKGCSMNPCKHGTCQEDNFSMFKCTCDKGYGGDRCESLLDMCESNPCAKGVRCHNLVATVNSTESDFFCECPFDFGSSSKTCSYRTIDPCVVSPCLNNAPCSSTSEYRKIDGSKLLIYTDFKCKCPTGFTGDLCEERITSCATDPCQNRGRCTPSRIDNSFTCTCFPAFTGKLCEHLLDQCASFPCNNGATCMSTPNGPKCQCPINFIGNNCEQEIKPCDTMNCLNNGECLTNKQSVPFCKCFDKRFTGTQCEIDLTQFTNSTKEARSEKISESDEFTACGVLGNNVTTMDYIFFILVIASIVIVIIGIIYIYVQVKIKRVKRYLRKVNFDNEITTEINQVTVSKTVN